MEYLSENNDSFSLERNGYSEKKIFDSDNSFKNLLDGNL